MGIAAIQGRLLALTNRQPNLGAELEAIKTEKTELIRQQEALKNEYKKIVGQMKPSDDKELQYAEDKSIISKDAKELSDKYSDTKLENEVKDENKTFEKEEKAVTEKLTGYQKLMANNINKAYKTFAS